jgi:hypothetical protein
MRRFLPMIVGLVLMTACAVQPDNAKVLLIDGLKIENRTQLPVSAVRVLVPATGGFVSCSSISAQSMCSTSFPETRFSGNPIEISWRQSGQAYSTGQVELNLPEGVITDMPAMVHVVIVAPGSAGALLVQHQKR